MSLDGHLGRFAYATVNTDGEATQPQVIVVQNWFEELRRLVPTN